MPTDPQPCNPAPSATGEFRKTILIVDDNVDAAKPLARMLSQFGHRGIYLTSGEAALSYLSDSEIVPALLVLDVMMPGIDGLEVLRSVRSNPRTASIPVVMFSAISDPAVRTQAMSKGATDFWVKASLDFDELRYRVEQLTRASVH